MRVRPLETGDLAVVAALHERREAVDGRPALSEHKAVRLGHNDLERVLVAGDAIVGSAHVARRGGASGGHWAAELVIDPEWRDASSAVTLLLAELVAAVPGQAPITWWAWRDEEVARAEQSFLRERRALLQMARPLPIELQPDPPEGVKLTRFRPGVDEDVWLAANNAAFAGHPENGALDRDDLAVRMGRPWFDPAGFVMAWRGEELAGFCWTKLHDGEVGEIYIIGVVPAAQGIGLGKALVVEGLDDLSSRQGATTAMLWVGAEDGRAIGLYERLGFEVVFTSRELVLRD